MAMMLDRTAPPTRRQQPSICRRSNILAVVLPLTWISTFELSGTAFAGPLSASVIVPNSPCWANRLLNSCLIFLTPVSNGSRIWPSSMTLMLNRAQNRFSTVTNIALRQRGAG